MKHLAKIAATLIAARITWIIAKPIVAYAYNRMTPDIDWDAIEDDGFITVHPEMRV